MHTGQGPTYYYSQNISKQASKAAITKSEHPKKLRTHYTTVPPTPFLYMNI